MEIRRSGPYRSPLIPHVKEIYTGAGKPILIQSVQLSHTLAKFVPSNVIGMITAAVSNPRSNRYSVNDNPTSSLQKRTNFKLKFWNIVSS